ncbi:tetratricopeptide repeat protein [Mariniblastus fucicola]|uniref:Tetratricopeptide repeat protein n=1 Tax=Mariniblastus fucicola TaxID=980251 RepID=A0A5B9PFP2_9BACT|nr:hypothetical protein [Mariniblastus fucicola]QEG25114.1 tetratricopeptide repeat protein [Mariniblastus fucicola]
MKLLQVTVILFVAAVSSGISWGQIGDQATQEPAQANRFENSVDQSARAQRALENIEKAIAVLIPGGIEPGSPRQKNFAAVIESFAKGQARDAMDALEKMATEDANLPPAEVVMAGLTFAVGDNKSGMVLLESGAIKHADYPGVYLSFAQIAINAGRLTDASLHADKTARLIETGNLSPERKSHFLKQYFEIATSIHLRRKQDEKAQEMLAQLQNVAPNLPFYLRSKAELAFRAGQNDQALQFLKQYATATESKRLPELTLVDWTKNSGKDEAAKELLLNTIQQHPSDATAHMMAAQMHMAGEDFPNALMSLKKFEDLNGEETQQSLDMKGRIAFAGLSYELAAEHFRKLSQLTPNDPSSANILALCLIESDDPELQKQAMQISQRVASRMSGNTLALASLAYIYLKNGEKEKSQQLMQRVAVSRQATPEVSYFLANWLVENGQAEQAANILQQALDSKGLFLYRSASRKMLSRLNADE